MKNVFNFFSWFFGLFFIMGGVGNLISANTLFGLLGIVVGILLLPPTKEQLVSEFPFLSYKKITIISIVIFLISSYLSPYNSNIENSEKSLNIQKDESTLNENKLILNEIPDIANWNYNQTKDEMRSQTTFFAETTSLNIIDLNFPYQGGSYLELVIRKVENSSNEVMFIINKGQLWCEYNNCKITVKFDDNPVKDFYVSKATAGSSEVMFLSSNEEEFISKLKKSKNAVIEIGIYDSGNQQFKFNTSDLNW